MLIKRNHRTQNYTKIIQCDDRGELEVFDFNKKAIKSYLKTGFQIDSLEKVSLADGSLGEVLKMSITKTSFEGK